HVLSHEGERLLAMSTDMAGVPGNVFSLLTNADIEFPKIKDETGTEVELTEERYSFFLHSRDRRLRRDAFKGLFSSYKKVRNTLSATYLGSLKKDVFYAKARNYESTLQASLQPQNIPLVVYEKAIETINEWLDPLRRYIDFKKEVLKLDKVHFYDLYVPLLLEPKASFSFEDAKNIVIEGLAPLGEEYRQALLQALQSRWVDVYENKGKRSGAYSWGVYGVHPYVLLNFNGMLRDVFTLAHEMGHAMHSHFTFKNQPYVYSSASIFTAEVASTTNEILLSEYLIRNADNKAEKAYLINYDLEQVRTTVYRQLLFAEFELEVHKSAERGKPLTSKDFSVIWKNLYEKHYSDTLFIDDELSLEWARIPHFYDAYYVYQYATGYSAATAIATSILEEGEAAVDRYLRFLSLGSSVDPVDALKVAGVDMTSPRPLELTCKKFKKDLDSLISLLESE
ncbi:MAG TPA: oligoendopeptidase F, partial [Acetomicrobium sp.]|nr:oligoendopeptidase F [Acetomicrobium sp.]